MPSDEEAGFLAAIALAGDDRAPRLVFADWLDEHERPEEAEYHRNWTPLVAKLEKTLADATHQIALLKDEIRSGQVPPCGC